MKTLEQTGLTLLEAAHKVRAERADQRADMRRDEGAIVHLTYAMGKMRRIFQACTTLNGRSAQKCGRLSFLMSSIICCLPHSSWPRTISMEDGHGDSGHQEN